MKNTFKLKAIQRIAGIIALVAVIGFSMAACGGDDDSGGGSSDGGGGGGSGGISYPLGRIPDNYLNTVWKYEDNSLYLVTYTITFSDSTSTFKFERSSGINISPANLILSAYDVGVTPNNGYSLAFDTNAPYPFPYQRYIHFSNDGSRLQFLSNPLFKKQ